MLHKMKKTKLLQFPLVIVFTLIFSGNLIAQNSFSIQGQVVDDEGNGISEAFITLEIPPCKVCFDDILLTVDTAEDGYFFFSVHDLFKDKNIKQVKMSIGTYSSTKGLWNPLIPVDSTLKDFPEFQLISIKYPESGQIIDLGKISPNSNYKAVSINLSKLFDFENNGYSENRPLKVSIKYKGVKVRHNLIIPEKFFDTEKGMLNLTMPTGKWELLFETNKNSESGKVIVDVNNKTRIFYLN